MQDYSYTKNNRAGFKLLVLGLILITLAVAAALIYYNSKINKPLTYFSASKIFEIKKGETVTAVGARLEQEKLISSPLVFRIYSVLHSELRVQAGKFELDSNMSIREILEKLSRDKGLADDVQITFKEGQTASEYTATLEAKGLANKNEFMKIVRTPPADLNYQFLADKPAKAGLEGYLFPDTYRFSRAVTPNDIIKKMLDNFDRKLTADLRAEIKRQGKTVFDIVTMASLVEGEVGRNYKTGTTLSEGEQQKLSQERRLVAGVFYNRLKASHALESDATIRYITGSTTHQATREETKVKSPYNTYTNRGLPPGPINSPSMDSILAAVYPADTDYFYFLSKLDGEAVFAKTLDEHNANKAKYLR